MNDRDLLDRDLMREVERDSMRDIIRGGFGRQIGFRTATAPSAGAKRPPHPFLSMRPYYKFAGRVPNTAWGGVEQFLQLKQEAFCGGLLIRVGGQYDIAVSGTMNARAGYAAIAKFKINPPGGAQPWNIDGWNTKMFNLVDVDFDPFTRGIDIEGVTPTLINGVGRNTTTDELFPNAIAAGQLYQLWYFIPFHRSAYDLRGLLPVGTDDPYQLGVTPGAIADVFVTPGNVTNATMTVDVWQLIYERPVAGSLKLDQRWLYVTEERVNPAGPLAVGEYEVIIPKRESIVTDFLTTVILNNALDSVDVSVLTLEIDGYFFHNAFDRRAWDRIVRGFLGKTPPLGVIYYPWDRMKSADGAIAQFDSYYALSMSEWIDTTDVSTLSHRFTITGGVAGVSQARTAIRRLTRVQ